MRPWICKVCTYQNSHEGSCKVCGKGQNPAPDGKWRCSHCTLLNSTRVLKCEVCHYGRPSGIISDHVKVAQPSPKVRRFKNNPFQDGRNSSDEEPENHNPRAYKPAIVMENPFQGRKSRQQMYSPQKRQVDDNSMITIEPKVRRPEALERPPPPFTAPPPEDIKEESHRWPTEDEYRGRLRPPRSKNDYIQRTFPVEIKPSSSMVQSQVPVQANQMDYVMDVEEVKQGDFRSNKLRAPEAPGIHAPIPPRTSLSQAIAEDTSFKKPPISMAMDIDIGTQELIRRLMQEEVCMLCHEREGYEIGGCKHKVCESCGKNKILEGIANQKWAYQPLTCPIENCESNLPPTIVTHFGLGKALQEKLETMQQKFNMSKTEGLVKCPQCGFEFVGEPGKVIKGQVERGRNNLPLTEDALKHKAKYRFRCSECKNNFCGKCSKSPYHLGDTCETFKTWKQSKKCRFCHATIDPHKIRHKSNWQLPGLDDVCHVEECQTRRAQSCGKVHSCGHVCIGIRGEKRCPPCYHPDCAAKGDRNWDDFCSICWTEDWTAAPCVQLECKHVVHYHCLIQKLEKKWPAARLVFNYMSCGECKKPIKHPELRKMLNPHEQLKRKVEKMALDQLKREGFDKDKRIQEKGGKYYNNRELFAMDRLAYYICFKCKKPYYGGMRKCDAQDIDKWNKEHLVCGGCRMGSNKKTCKIHGTDFIMWKCKFCCSRGSWFCWGNTHFCDDCHKRQESGDYLNRKPMSAHPKCKGRESGNPLDCPLKIKHPPNGNNFCLGCNVCLIS